MMVTGELADRAHELAVDRVPFVVATVVRARRPTSVRAGDAALVSADGRIEGFVGGVCAESSVRMYALRALETGEPVLLRIEPGEPSAQRGAALDGAVVEHNPCLSGGALEIFIEPQLPSSRLCVFGGSPIAIALRRLAAAAGYDVSAGPVEADSVAVVVASHGASEEEELAAALLAGVPYVALVASPRRGEAVRAGLDVPDELRLQLHTPAGLDLGARTPAEIAISILAEMVAEHYAHPAASVIPRTAVDPVCGMEVAISPATPLLEIGAEPLYFCSEGCREAYAAQHA